MPRVNLSTDPDQPDLTERSEHCGPSSNHDIESVRKDLEPRPVPLSGLTSQKGDSSIAECLEDRTGRRGNGVGLRNQDHRSFATGKARGDGVDAD
jgi:hypothetical protein